MSLFAAIITPMPRVAMTRGNGVVRVEREDQPIHPCGDAGGDRR